MDKAASSEQHALPGTANTVLGKWHLLFEGAWRASLRVQCLLVSEQHESDHKVHSGEDALYVTDP